MQNDVTTRLSVLNRSCSFSKTDELLRTSWIITAVGKVRAQASGESGNSPVTIGVTVAWLVRPLLFRALVMISLVIMGPAVETGVFFVICKSRGGMGHNKSNTFNTFNVK